MNSFVVYGKIRGKGRPRFARGHTYTPEKTVEYENLIKRYFLTSSRIKHTAEVGMIITCIFTKKIICKPDIDNIAKIVLDSLNGLAYEDDTQVVKLEIEKQLGEEECLIIETYDF